MSKHWTPAGAAIFKDEGELPLDEDAAQIAGDAAGMLAMCHDLHGVYRVEVEAEGRYYTVEVSCRRPGSPPGPGARPEAPVKRKHRARL